MKSSIYDRLLIHHHNQKNIVIDDWSTIVDIGLVLNDLVDQVTWLGRNLINFK